MPSLAQALRYLAVMNRLISKIIFYCIFFFFTFLNVLNAQLTEEISSTPEKSKTVTDNDLSDTKTKALGKNDKKVFVVPVKEKEKTKETEAKSDKADSATTNTTVIGNSEKTIKGTVIEEHTAPKDNNKLVILPKKDPPENSDNKTIDAENSEIDPQDVETGKAPSEPKKLFGPGMKKEDSKKEDSGIKISLFRYVISIIVVIILIGGTFYALKKVSNKIQGKGYGSLMVNQRLQLDAKNSLYLVQVHEEEVLIAVGPRGSKVLSKYDALETAANDDEDDDQDSLTGLERSRSKTPKVIPKSLMKFYQNKPPLRPDK